MYKMQMLKSLKSHFSAASIGVSLLQPIAYGAFVSIQTAIVVTEARAQALIPEDIAQIAKGITVRIEGATQGSGVLVKREGNRHTVLTAWHVVSGQKHGEELEIYTSDGKRHSVTQGSIRRLGEVDLAILEFSSPFGYLTAETGSAQSVPNGSQIFVSGYPLATSAVPDRILRFFSGILIAEPTRSALNGHELLYSTPTLPGMSGGPVLNSAGKVVGIHASAERADQISTNSGKIVATGTNQGVPVSYYSKYLTASTCKKLATVTMDDIAGTYVALDRDIPTRLIYRRDGTWERVHTGDAKISAKLGGTSNVITFAGTWRLEGDLMTGEYTSSTFPNTYQIWNARGEAFIFNFKRPGSRFSVKIALAGCNQLVFMSGSGLDRLKRISD
jgi:V8-like Glu-specific endopeptidase